MGRAVVYPRCCRCLCYSCPISSNPPLESENWNGQCRCRGRTHDYGVDVQAFRSCKNGRIAFRARPVEKNRQQNPGRR